MMHKLYLPQGYDKLTPYMKQMKDAQSQWMPDSLFADFDPNCEHQGWVDIIKACDANSTKELAVWPSPDQTFGDNAPYKKTSIMPIENEFWSGVLQTMLCKDTLVSTYVSQIQLTNVI